MSRWAGSGQPRMSRRRCTATVMATGKASSRVKAITGKYIHSAGGHTGGRRKWSNRVCVFFNSGCVPGKSKPGRLSPGCASKRRELRLSPAYRVVLQCDLRWTGPFTEVDCMDDAKLREVLAQMTEALKQANKEAYDAHLYAQELELALLRVPELSKRFEQER